MARDALLPADIVPSARDIRRPHVMLITGATGFLGRHLVSQLLERPELRIVCLVRAANDAAATQRLQAAVGRVRPDQPDLPEHISAVAGDVAKEHLGLAPAAFEELAGQVGEIIHCAAEVNWQRSYAQLRPVNVNGCLEIIRLACTGPPKRIQFVSTIGVCFAGSNFGRVDEFTETLPQVGVMPLGYAQSKCVAENLFRQAAQRGVPVGILRPGLISGDSATGASDHDDLLSAMFEGCINARAAPDIDWLVDCVPVDSVATVLARLTGIERPPWEILHLVHDRGRHWREIVLWMNLHGHDVSLLPIEEWNELVFRHGAPSARLRRFRRFFCGRRGNLSEAAPYAAYLATEQRCIDSARSQAVLHRLGLRPPPLDAALLARYLEHYAAAGLVRRSRPAASVATDAVAAGALLELAIKPWLTARGLEAAEVSERPFHDSDGILNELSAVRDGERAGIRLFDVTVGGDGAAPVRVKILLKAKARDTLLQDLTVEVASRCNPELGHWFGEFRSDLGLSGCHEREIALYRLAEPRLRRHTPLCYGAIADGQRDVWALAIEFVENPDLADRDARLVRWTAPQIDTVIDGLAQIHSIWFGKEALLERQPWLTNVVDVRRRVAMTPLWSALARFAAPRFSEWLAGPTMGMQSTLIRAMGDRSRALEALPRTLIHNDFNPRNLVLRGTGGRRSLCVFDWELATIGVPQHDLAEFLCFTLPEGAEAGDVAAWLERHRTLLAAAAGAAVPATDWMLGFQLALQQLLVDRLSMYTLIHRFRPLSFLPQVIRNWSKLHRIGVMLLAAAPRTFNGRGGRQGIRSAGQAPRN